MKKTKVPKMKMTTSIPQEITTPDVVETRLGTLKFFDGLPDHATVQKLFDNLDFMRGVEVFLNTMAAGSSLAQFRGLRSVGADNQTVVLHQDRLDAKSLLLTANTQTATLWGVGLADDAWMTYIVDMGVVGPDKGQGGKYLFLPPGYKGDVPEGYFVAQSKTYEIGYGLRGFTVKGDTGPAVAAFKTGGQSAGDEDHHGFWSLLQHHPAQHLPVLRVHQRPHPGGT